MKNGQVAPRSIRTPDVRQTEELQPPPPSRALPDGYGRVNCARIDHFNKDTLFLIAKTDVSRAHASHGERRRRRRGRSATAAGSTDTAALFEHRRPQALAKSY
eukprot:6213014-Pleurochrysis_carterae.AAC.3